MRFSNGSVHRTTWGEAQRPRPKEAHRPCQRRPVGGADIKLLRCKGVRGGSGGRERGGSIGQARPGGDPSLGLPNCQGPEHGSAGVGQPASSSANSDRPPPERPGTTDVPSPPGRRSRSLEQAHEQLRRRAAGRLDAHKVDAGGDLAVRALAVPHGGGPPGVPRLGGRRRSVDDETRKLDAGEVRARQAADAGVAPGDRERVYVVLRSGDPRRGGAGRPVQRGEVGISRLSTTRSPPPA